MNQKLNEGPSASKRIVTPEAIADLYRRCGAVDLADTVESSLTTAMAQKSAAINELVTAYRNDEPVIDVAESEGALPPRNVEIGKS